MSCIEKPLVSFVSRLYVGSSGEVNKRLNCFRSEIRSKENVLLRRALAELP